MLIIVKQNEKFLGQKSHIYESFLLFLSLKKIMSEEKQLNFDQKVT